MKSKFVLKKYSNIYQYFRNINLLYEGKIMFKNIDLTKLDTLFLLYKFCAQAIKPEFGSFDYTIYKASGIIVDDKDYKEFSPIVFELLSICKDYKFKEEDFYKPSKVIYKHNQFQCQELYILHEDVQMYIWDTFGKKYMKYNSHPCTSVLNKIKTLYGDDALLDIRLASQRQMLVEHDIFKKYTKNLKHYTYDVVLKRIMADRMYTKLICKMSAQ